MFSLIILIGGIKSVIDFQTFVEKYCTGIADWTFLVSVATTVLQPCYFDMSVGVIDSLTCIYKLTLFIY